MVWIIRPEQMKALRRVRWIAFEEEMLVHLTKYFAIDCQLLGSRQIRKVIRHGIERADAHGFRVKGEISGSAPVGGLLRLRCYPCYSSRFSNG